MNFAGPTKYRIKKFFSKKINQPATENNFSEAIWNMYAPPLKTSTSLINLFRSLL